MATPRLLNPADLGNLLDYDPLAGTFTFREAWEGLFDESGRISAAARCSKWNKRNSGKPALTTMNAEGYLCGRIMGRQEYAHRVARAIMDGDWPVEVDHVNGVRSDNRLANLRVVDRQDNTRNSAKPSTNTSGHGGVSFRTRYGTWRATINAEGRSLHLGTFRRKQDAIDAHTEAKLRLGFTERHGT